MHRRWILTITAAALLSGGASASQKTSRASEAVNSNRPDVTTDVVYGHKAGMALTFDIYRPRMPNGAGVISIISAGWRSDWDMLRQFRETPDGSFRLMTDTEIGEQGGILPSHSYRKLLEQGFTVFAIRHGSSPNFGMPAIVADLRRGVRFIRMRASTYGVDPQRIGIWGGSAGGHLALLLATTAEITNPTASDEFERGPAKLAAVVAYAPPTDLVTLADVWRQSTVTYPVMQMSSSDLKTYSPISHVSADDPPTLIVHGDQDKTVPMSQGRSMHEALLKAGVVSQFVTMEGSAHGFLGQAAERANAEMVHWFETYLGHLPSPAQAGQSQERWFGTWTVNFAKSTYAPGAPPHPQSTITRVEPWEGGMRYITDTVTAQGQTRHTEWSAKFDGRDYAVKGVPTVDTYTLRRVDDHTYEVIAKKDGKVTTTSRSVISADGKIRTVTQLGQHAGGDTVNNTLVFDRQ